MVGGLLVAEVGPWPSCGEQEQRAGRRDAGAVSLHLTHKQDGERLGMAWPFGTSNSMTHLSPS